MRTSDLARTVGVHPNTIRLHEAEGFIAQAPRADNGYRQYTRLHLEQVKLARLALRWPYLGNRKLLAVSLSPRTRSTCPARRRARRFIP